MSKIWWRLADVWPLAEHAIHTPIVATPYHLLPRYPPQSDLPGLIWQNVDGEETLRSNGWPGWYDKSGWPHRAHALTWRRPATVTGAIQVHPQRDRELLLLTIRAYDRRGRPLIATIRRGVAQRHHWFWIDTSVSPFTCATTDHRDDIVPENAGWVTASVTAHAVGGQEFPALIADGYTGADGVLPRFTRATATRIAQHLAYLNDDRQRMPGVFPAMKFEGDTAVISWQVRSLADKRVLEIDRCYPDVDGLYAVGAYLWTWTRVAADGHDCVAAQTLRFAGVYGAPGFGQAWNCQVCGRGWSRLGGVFHPAESQAHILTVHDVE